MDFQVAYQGIYQDDYQGEVLLGLVTITGQTCIANSDGYFDSFIVRQISGLVNYDGKQLIQKNIYVTPNQSTGAWSIDLYPADFEFVFRDGQNAIREYKTVTVSANYEDLTDYTGN